MKTPTNSNVWLHSSVGRATHWQRGGHGFETRWSPDFFFRLLLSNCLNSKIYCDDHSSLSSTTAVQKWIIFIYLTSVCSNLCRSPTCQIESKAFLKPTKQAYIFSLWLWTYLSIKVRGAKTWSAVRLFGKKPIWDLWRWSVFKDMTCSRSRWFKMGRNNFPSQLETQISR